MAEQDLEKIDEVLNLAKLNHSDLLPTAQVVYFASENVQQHDYKLLELDKHLLQTLQEGDSIYIKGDDDDNAVLCTETQTYDVVETETSNSLLLCQNLKFESDLREIEERNISKVEVSGICYDYLEVIPSKPRLGKLKELLNRTLYKGPELENDIDKTYLFTYDELLNRTQASRREFDLALKAMHVIKIDDKLRLLDFKYHCRVLTFMVRLLDENAWALDEVDYDVTMNLLGDLVPTAVLESLFDLYLDPSKIVDNLQLYKYKEVDVCRTYAQILLLDSAKFNLNEFLQSWNEFVPEGMAPQLDMLHGLAIVEQNTNTNAIRSFPEEQLSENITERFNALFETKEKWTVPEITPYIKPLATDKVDVNALLAKHARSSSFNNVKYYSAKHTK